MKARTVFSTSLALVPVMVFGRMFKVDDPGTLIVSSQLVFVGRVESVKPSSITTSLSYVPWDGVTFRWLMVEVKVLESFKGVRKGEIVHTAMLSVDERSRARPMYSPPGMLEPEKGDVFLLCLSSTPQTNVFAAVRAPYNENLSVFPLHRSRFSQNEHREFTKQWMSQDERFALVWNLVNDAGQIIPANTEQFRKTYATEIGNTATNKLIYLEWETYTNPSSWRSDVPKGYGKTTNSNSR